MLAELPFPAVSTPCVHPLPHPAPGRRASAGRRGPVRRAGGWLLLLLGLLSGAATTALAQGTPPPECSKDEKFANTWYFGYKAGLDFNQATDSIPPKVLTDGQMTAPAGAGVMSDGNGKILFYSNGDTIWNGNGSIMTNGTGMGGNRLVTDGPLPIKLPGSPPPTMPGAETRYLIFTQDAAGGPKGLSYSEIIIPAGGGPGTVTLATKNTPLTPGHHRENDGRVFTKTAATSGLSCTAGATPKPALPTGATRFWPTACGWGRGWTRRRLSPPWARCTRRVNHRWATAGR